MGNQEQVQKLYASLGQLDKSAVREAVHSVGGELSSSRFEAKYGRLPNLWSRTDSSKLSAFFPLGWWLPSDLRSMLRGFVPEPEVASVKTVDELPEAVAEVRSSLAIRTGKERTIGGSATDASHRDGGAKGACQFAPTGRVRQG